MGVLYDHHEREVEEDEIDALVENPKAAAGVMGAVQAELSMDVVDTVRSKLAAREDVEIVREASPYPHPEYPEARTLTPLVAVVPAELEAVYADEQFGPVLPIIRYSDVDEIIAKANENPHGLGGSIWGSDIAKAKELAQRLEAGTVWVNKHGAIQPNVPFGGVKCSGIGVEFGEEGLKEYTNVQIVWV